MCPSRPKTPPPSLTRRSLTPIFVLKSRAHEYRESMAKACIERACEGRGDPVPFLRRAVELVADTGVVVHGLTPETVAYVQSHPSNAYDRWGGLGAAAVVETAEGGRRGSARRGGCELLLVDCPCQIQLSGASAAAAWQPGFAPCP